MCRPCVPRPSFVQSFRLVTSVSPSFCPCLRPFACPSFRPSVLPSLRQSFRVLPSARPSLCLTVRPSFRLSVCPCPGLGNGSWQVPLATALAPVCSTCPCIIVRGHGPWPLARHMLVVGGHGSSTMALGPSLWPRHKARPHGHGARSMFAAPGRHFQISAKTRKLIGNSCRWFQSLANCL